MTYVVYIYYKYILTKEQQNQSPVLICLQKKPYYRAQFCEIRKHKQKSF